MVIEKLNFGSMFDFNNLCVAARTAAHRLFLFLRW